ncbi:MULTISPECIES: hypothetical protein [unclassified Nostoc]|uniref:hypothetical protein n=1 Tax=unclassified Nostoc TaxID=2593658 RepID=UPI00261B7B91|nr:hypothetical protein [Nostoc sp. S13]MDF5739433.1 hypothetical protein [Nostoc sp. S13]
MESEYLNLLTPQQLPTQLTLSYQTNERVSEALKLILEALNHSCADLAGDKLNQALIILGETKRAPVNDPLTHNSFLSLEKIDDFDRYFQIVHVQTEDTAIVLVSSLLIALREFLLLSESKDFNSSKVIDLKKGYQEYIKLLTRVFTVF